jgi:CRP-like cAMP-binding protein
VLDVDVALAESVEAGALAEARLGAIAPLVALSPGPWDPRRTMPLDRSSFGVLVVAGFLACRVRLGELGSIDFVGRGDVMHPAERAPSESVGVTTTWDVLTPTKLLVLDADFARRVRPWPEIPAALLCRASERAGVLRYQLAAREAVRVEDRLLLILWQMAERWGRVGPRGTILRVPGLSHEVLARIVGARRSPVSKAMKTLKERGLVGASARGEFILHGQPPDAAALS